MSNDEIEQQAGSGSTEDNSSVLPEANPFEMVQEIEKILADDPADRVVTRDSIEFPLPAALELIPRKYLKDVDPEDVYGETVLVEPEDLYEQLARGKVEVPLSKLAYYVPMHLIYHSALSEETTVHLPLKTVVKAVGIEELKRRTPENFRLYDISVFDDPFKEGDASLVDDVGLVLEDEDEGASPPDDTPLVLEDEAVVEETAAGPEPKTGKQEDLQEVELPAAGDGTPVEEYVAEKAEEIIAEPVPAPEQIEAVDVDSVSYQVSALMETLPVGIVSPEADVSGNVDLEIPSLLAQLRKGVVSMSLTEIAGSLPEGVLSEQPADTGATVNLDLKATVEAVGLDALKSLTPSKVRTFDIDWMADPFPEPEEKPDLEAVRAQKKELKKAQKEKSVEVPAADQAPAKVTVYTPSGDADSELEYFELPGNININAASREELMLLKGVGAHLAHGVVAYRERHGGFKSVFDLFRVDGIDEIRFRQMTGMKSEQKRRHRRKRLASMLKIPAARVADLSLVAQAVSRKAGFNGCVISDGDGLVLAQSGLDALADSLSAVLPSILGRINHGMDLAELKVTGTVTIAVDGQLFTVQSADNVILTAAHADNMVSDADLAFMKKVGRELAWLLSVRAYAGPMV